MAHRFFVVLYAFLHIPLLFSFMVFSDNHIWSNLNNDVYQVRCTSNNQVVILQGATDGSPYTFDDINLSAPSYKKDIEENSRFYCAHYNEVQKHVAAYVESLKPGGNTVIANQEYFEFKLSAPKTYYKNYTHEVIGTDNSYYQLWNAVFEFFILLIGGYLLLQLARIIYQYIAFGKFNWRPYKKIEK